MLSSTFPGLWTCIKTQRGLAKATKECQYDGKNSTAGRSEFRWEEFHFLAERQSQNCSRSTRGTQVFVGYIHLDCIPISLFPVKSCSQPNMFVKAGVENKVKSQYQSKMSFSDLCGQKSQNVRMKSLKCSFSIYSLMTDLTRMQTRRRSNHPPFDYSMLKKESILHCGHSFSILFSSILVHSILH